MAEILLLQGQPEVQYQLAAGAQEIIIEQDGPLHLQLSAPSGQQSYVMIRLRQAPQLEIRADWGSESHVTVVFWNESHRAFAVDEEYTVGSQAIFRIAYGEWTETSGSRRSRVNLGRDAEVLLRSAALCFQPLDLMLECTHLMPGSKSEMQNSAIVLQNGHYRLQAIGRISKGAKAAGCHQSSRALTFDRRQQTTITPQLYIDDNDVQASHATVIGQMDEQQMFYLQSRGLTRPQAIRLVTAGYLQPVLDLIEQEAMRTQLQQQMEMKVDELCMMLNK